jgi:phage tail-like protein
MAEIEYDVLVTSRYYLELHTDKSDDRIDGYFMECSGFERTQKIAELSQVTPLKWGAKGVSIGQNVGVKVPIGSDSGNITLKRGLTLSKSMWNWFESIDDGNWFKQRRDADLTLYDEGGIERLRYRLTGAIPIRYKISDLSAGQGELAVEEIELAIDEFSRVK